MVELTAPELWSRIQESVQASVPEQSYLTWVRPAVAVAFTSNELHLEVPSRFHVEWLEDKFGPVLSASSEAILGKPIKITVTCSATALSVPVASVDLTTPLIEDAAERDIPSAASDSSTVPLLNDRYTFERFVVGADNQLAAAAARAVANRPAKTYNPLFLYGGVGLGKTHLMHAIGHHMGSENPQRSVCYVSSEQFMNDLVASIQQGTTAAFRRQYREMDLLLVDDIHFLEGKERTQEEFFHTFNALYDAQRQIVLTSDRPPKDLSGLENRLVSRFEWGLVVDVKPPDYETRMAILQKKAADDGFSLDSEVIELIAHSCTASVRELEGAVIKLLAYSSLTNREITPDLARAAFRGALGQQRERGPVLSPERIREIVARRWRVRADALASKRRTKDLTIPRQVAMFLIKEAFDLSLVRIGEFFGGRDHSTVIHSIRKVEEDMERDPVFRELVHAAREDFTGTDSASV
ncbi:MAG TPA: chromosomal replication initiator protein DnaA [Gemmatimonadetes bacterium]|nr:chromosomal replication initiator protein DnaA [Gemmatimonadota bacterium]